MTRLNTQDVIQVFTLGGTIDKVYFDALSEYQVGKPTVGGILQDAGLYLPYDIHSICSKDSLDITDDDRAHLLQAIHTTQHRHILVTHGTDTMTTTAQYVKNALEKSTLGQTATQTIVFAGAMNPACFKQSDAPFNIGFALGALRASQPGIYIAMNGSIFDPDKAIKNRDAGQFEPASTLKPKV